MAFSLGKKRGKKKTQFMLVLGLKTSLALHFTSDTRRIIFCLKFGIYSAIFGVTSFFSELVM